MTLKEAVTHHWEFFSEEVTIELQSHKVGEEHCNRRNSTWKLFFFPFLPSCFDSCTGLVSLASVRIRWFALSWWDKHDKPKNNGFLFIKAAWLQKRFQAQGSPLLFFSLNAQRRVGVSTKTNCSNCRLICLFLLNWFLKFHGDKGRRANQSGRLWGMVEGKDASIYPLTLEPEQWAGTS